MQEGTLKFIVDVGVGNQVEDYLIKSNYDIISIRKIDHTMKDSDILKIAKEKKGIVITMDKDFGELIFNSGMSHFGVLLLRLDDSSGSEKVKILKEILLKHRDDMANNFCVYQNSRLRIKKG